MNIIAISSAVLTIIATSFALVSVTYTIMELVSCTHSRQWAVLEAKCLMFMAMVLW